DNTAPVARCQNVSVNLVGNSASVTAAQVNNGSTDNCGTPTVSITPTTFNCGAAGGNTVTLTATDASNNTSTCTATVTVNEVTPPTITTCPSNQTITDCIAPSYTGSVVATDNCTIASITQSPAAGASLGIGHGQSTSITYTVTDQSGNIRTCSNTVTVNDQTPPTATCNNLTVTLDPVTNQATVNASQLTTNSTDACNPVTSIVPAWKASPGSCAGAACLSGGASFPAVRNGGGTYTYTKTNCLATSRNESWFYFNVTSSGSISMPVSISPASDIDYACWGPFTSVSNACANFSTANQVSCDYSGANGGTISISSAATGYYILVISNFGNQAGSISLSNNAGTATVAACSSISGTETSYVYNQTNLGPNTVTVQVTDAAGNSSTCNATVTVVVNDPTPPVATCQNVSVSLDGSNSATIRASDIDGGSSDNVAISSYSLSKTGFNCSNIGANVVTLTVSDPGGNTATCNSVVTVNDVTAPTFADPADVTLTTSAAADCPTPASITLVANQATPVATNNTAFSYTVHGKTHSGPTSYSDNCATGSDLKLYCWAINTDNTGAANNCSRQIRITWRVYDKNNANYTEQTQLFTIN
ncbi:MAG: HYR domain-containing protein, partial [Bacteroidota bacterium]